MKKISSILVLASLILFAVSSCKKDDKKEDSILGKWTLVKSEWKEVYEGEDIGGTITFTQNDQVTFNEDKTFTWIADDETMAGSWVQSGSTVTLTGTVDDEPMVVQYTIKTLTATSLVVHLKVTNGDDTYEETVHLKR